MSSPIVSETVIKTEVYHNRINLADRTLKYRTQNKPTSTETSTQKQKQTHKQNSRNTNTEADTQTTPNHRVNMITLT